jgi:hypothetical protein
MQGQSIGSKSNHRPSKMEKRILGTIRCLVIMHQNHPRTVEFMYWPKVLPK